MTQRAPWVGSYLRLLFEPMASRCVHSELEFCLLCVMHEIDKQLS